MIECSHTVLKYDYGFAKHNDGRSCMRGALKLCPVIRVTVELSSLGNDSALLERFVWIPSFFIDPSTSDAASTSRGCYLAFTIPHFEPVWAVCIVLHLVQALFLELCHHIWWRLQLVTLCTSAWPCLLSYHLLLYSRVSWFKLNTIKSYFSKYF